MISQPRRLSSLQPCAHRSDRCHVDMLICSNGINTASGLYKAFIQIFTVIAEFERDTLAERIVVLQ